MPGAWVSEKSFPIGKAAEVGWVVGGVKIHE